MNLSRIDMSIMVYSVYNPITAILCPIYDFWFSTPHHSDGTISIIPTNNIKSSNQCL